MNRNCFPFKTFFKYLKYADNLKNKKFEEKFKLGEEERLMIEETGKGFGGFAKKTLGELNELAGEIREANKRKPAFMGELERV